MKEVAASSPLAQEAETLVVDSIPTESLNMSSSPKNSVTIASAKLNDIPHEDVHAPPPAPTHQSEKGSIYWTGSSEQLFCTLSAGARDSQNKGEQ